MRSWLIAGLLMGAVASRAQSPLDASPQINLTEHLQIQFDQSLSLDKARAVSRLGFKLVRLPVTSLDRDFVIVGSVRNLLRAGLNVVLDFHPDNTKDFVRTDDFWLAPAWWHNLASQFKGEHLDRLAFEIVNEPDYRGKPTERYDAWLRLCIEAIREVDPKRWIVASNPYMGDPDFFGGPNGNWTPPKGIDRLVVPMHYYRPFNITHSRNYLAKRRGETVARGARGAPYPPENDGSFDDRDYRNMGLHFSRYRNWCRQNGVWPWVGEAGCYEDVPGREQWFRDVKALGAKNGINICWWSTDGFAIGAKWDRDGYTLRFPEILRILTGR
ncbi:MAG: cellulase family glycosylhydrolase [Chthonomonas sp.]|nr:cellulase family glycosylhydrolase [Chthonomonas sp.]